MTQDPTPDGDLSPSLAAILARRDVWDEPDADVEQRVVASIVGEAAATSTETAGVTSLRQQRGDARTGARSRVLLGAAAVVTLVVAAGLLLSGRDETGGVVFALEGTAAEPGASAEARVSTTPAGMKILLTPIGLPGAPEGFMYEAWVSDDVIRVSAGTFHLRSGSGTIELWAGVADPSFRRLTVTLEPIDGDASSSLDARLRGEFDLGD